MRMSNFAGIQATTLHSWTGMGVSDTFKTLQQESLEISKKPDVLCKWVETDTLIIEEISMISPFFFQRIYDLAGTFQALRLQHRQNLRKQGLISDKEALRTGGFHGIQIILCGDWFQLEPIRKSDPPEYQKMNFCFETDAWKKSIGNNVVVLEQIYRQVDPDFIKILSEIRHGILTPESKIKLQSRLIKNWDNLEIKPITLFPRVNQVQKENSTRLSKLKGKEKIFEGKWNERNLKKEQFNILSKKMLSSFPIEKEPLILKEGASVLLIVNLSVSSGLVNGLQGVVKRFERLTKEEDETNTNDLFPMEDNTEYPVVEFENGTTLTVQNFSWHEAWNKERSKVVKKPTNHFEKKINWKHKDWVGLIYTQLPLKLGFSMSIHKAQGMGFEKVALDLGPKVFTAGQAYTALSRSKTLQGVYLLDFTKDSIMFNEKVLEFYETYSTDKDYSDNWRKQRETFESQKESNNNNNSKNNSDFNFPNKKRSNSSDSKDSKNESEDEMVKPKKFNRRYSKSNNDNQTPDSSSGCPF